MTDEHWTDSLEDGDLKTNLSGYESQEKLFDAIGYKAPEAPDWREGLDKDLTKVADRFTSPKDAFQSIQAFQKREGQVRVPSKDASDDDRNAYYKAIGVPETSDKYEFPEIPEDQLTDEIKASRGEWGEIFHKNNISQEQANSLTTAVNEIAERIDTAQKEAQTKADEDFVKEQEASLKEVWKGDEFEKNSKFANAAFAKIADMANVSLDELTKMETKDGRFLMDDARMLKLFSVIGKEMQEGSLGPTMTEGERDTVDEQIDSLRKQRDEAQANMDSKKANKIYQKELALIAKRDGDKPIVGVAV